MSKSCVIIILSSNKHVPERVLIIAEHNAPVRSLVTTKPYNRSFMKKLFIDSLSDNLTVIQKMSYEGIDAVHDALCFAFYPDGIDEDEMLDDRFMAIWNIFLASVGWNEEDYWDKHRTYNHHCPDCGEPISKHNGESSDKDDPSSKPN